MYQIALNKLLLFHLIIVELRFGMGGKISMECWIGFVSCFLHRIPKPEIGFPAASTIDL